MSESTIINPAEATLPFIVAAPPEPLYRRLARKPWAWFVAVLALGGIIAGALFLAGMFSSGSSGTAAVLGKDGFPVTMSLSKDQLSQMGLFSGSDGAAAKPYVTGASVGVKGDREEVVVGLTKPGADLIGPMIGLAYGSLPSGESAHMDGSNLVITGSASAMDGTSGLITQ